MSFQLELNNASNQSAGMAEKKTHGGKRPGAGRPPIPPSKHKRQMLVWLSPRVHREIKRIAKKTGLSQGEVVEARFPVE